MKGRFCRHRRTATHESRTEGGPSLALLEEATTTDHYNAWLAEGPPVEVVDSPLLDPYEVRSYLRDASKEFLRKLNARWEQGPHEARSYLRDASAAAEAAEEDFNYQDRELGLPDPGRSRDHDWDPWDR